MSKAKTKQEEALQFLDDLDSFEPPISTPSSGQAASAAPPAGEEEVYAFIDEITQKSSEPPRIVTTHIERPLSRAGTPTVRKGTERVKVGQSGSLLPSPSGSSSSLVTPRVATPAATKGQEPALAANSSGGWGWGSVWSSATAAVQQAKTIVDEQVKNLPKNEQARKWGEGVLEYAKTAQLDKLGKSYDQVPLHLCTGLIVLT